MEERAEKRKRREFVVRCVIAAVIAAAAVVLVWKMYQNRALFQPDKFAENKNLQENQVVFPGEDDYNVDEDSSGESDLWEQDKDSDERMGLDDIPDSSYLFEHERRIVDAQTTEKKIAQVSSGTDVPKPGGNETDRGEVFVPGEDDGNSTVIPGGGGQGENDGQGGAGKDDTSGNGEGDSGQNNGDPSGGGDSGNKDDGSQGGGDDSGSGSGDDTNKDDNDGDEPLIDPDPRPELPQDVYDNDYIKDPKPAFPDEGVVVEENQNVQLWIGDGIDAEAVEQLYYGAVIDDWKLLCACYAYVWIDGEPAYRLVSYGENFKVEGYPKRATEDFEAVFSFRINRESPWIQASYRFKVRPYKVVINGLDGNVIKNVFPGEGESIDLINYYDRLIPNECKDFFMPVNMTDLIVGWSESPGGSPVGNQYTPKTPGRHVLYALPTMPIQEDLLVSAQLDWDEYFPCFLQTLSGYLGDAEILEVPYGIHNIDMYGAVLKKIIIPGSVLKITEGGLDADEAYEVSGENSRYCSVDGMLFDKEQSKLCGIPLNKLTLTVPESVTKIQLSWQNQIQEIHIQSAQPPEIDLEFLNGARIYVPAGQYLKYLTAWGGICGDNKILPEGDGPADYVVRDGAVLSGDGKTLYQILASERGTYTVPEGVEIIKSEATDICAVERLILPDTIKTLEPASVTADCLKRIILQGINPPEVFADTFSAKEDFKVQVQKSAEDVYRQTWSEIFGEAWIEQHLIGENSELKEQNGFIYWQSDSGASLVRAPEDMTYFDENSLPGVTFTEILSEAFSGCKNLMIVELPETVSYIGKDAFAGCQSLQALFIRTAEKITVEKGAFHNCIRLRFIVSLAREAVFADGNLESGNGYCVPQSVGYPTEFQVCGDSYYLKPQEDGVLLYGEDEQTGERCLLNASSNISGEIILEPGTIEIAAFTFQGCDHAFSISEESLSGLKIIGTGAFDGCGLCGKFVFPEGLVSVGTEAFSRCTGLEEVEICSLNITSLMDYMFYCCESLKKVTFGDNCSIQYIGFGVFADTGLEEIVLPASLEKIGSLAFEGCTSLKSVTLSSAEPVELVMFSPGTAFSFGTVLPETFRIILPEDADEQQYIDTWKYSLLGVLSDTELSEAQNLQGENLVRNLLGLEEKRQQEKVQEEQTP